MIDGDVFADLARYDSATISNAIEAFAVRPRTEGFIDSTVQCVYRELPPIVGRAVTCRLENSDQSRSKLNRLGDLLDIVRGMEAPVVVVCSHLGPDPERSCLAGDLVSAMLQRLGAVGIVTDCAARDVDVVRRRAPGFQLFAGGRVASHGTGTIVEVGGPVTLAGLAVRTGEILHGDHNGVVSVPDEVAPSLASAAQKVLDVAEALQRRIHAESLDYEGIRADLTHQFPNAAPVFDLPGREPIVNHLPSPRRPDGW